MSESTTYQPAPGIIVRQRISVKQTTKGDFTRDYTIEVSGTLAAVYVEPDGPDVHGSVGDIALAGPDHREPLSTELINDIALRRAEADWSAHVARIQEGRTDE